MNQTEKDILTKLHWYLQESKNEHYIIYNAKEVLQSVLKGQYSSAENLVNAFHRNKKE